jgi:hypothetical protein
MADADDEQMTSLRRERNDFGVPRAIAEGRADRPTKRAVLRYRNALSRRPSRSIQWWTPAPERARLVSSLAGWSMSIAGISLAAPFAIIRC